MGDYLASRRDATDARLERLRQDLQAAQTIASDRACVYLTGSFARGEASAHSDLDLFIMGKGTRASSPGRDLHQGGADRNDTQAPDPGFLQGR